MQIGPYIATSIETGRFRLDGGAMFGTVPKVLWEKAHPADEKNRIELAARCLLLEGFNRRILVDTGLGDKWDAKHREMFAIETVQGGVAGALAARGTDPATITDVVLTHLHFDHAGGATKTAADGTIEPAFPHARYHLQKRNLEWAQKPNDREAASYRAENFDALVAADVLELHEGSRELYPGLFLVVADGHTEALQMVRVIGPGEEGEAEELWYPADMIPTSSHVPAAWVMGYDISALRCLEEKKALLSEIAGRNAWLFYEHDPVFAASRTESIGGKFRSVDGVSEL